MPDERFQPITPANRADYLALMDPLAPASWPEFMLHDLIGNRYWNDLFERFPEYQFGLLDTQTGKAAAMGKGVINTVSQQIMKIFAGNLQAMLSGGEDAGNGESKDGSVKGMTLVAGAIGSMFHRDKSPEPTKE